MRAASPTLYQIHSCHIGGGHTLHHAGSAGQPINLSALGTTTAAVFQAAARKPPAATHHRGAPFVPPPPPNARRPPPGNVTSNRHYLAARCEYFRLLFSSTWREGERPARLCQPLTNACAPMQPHVPPCNRMQPHARPCNRPHTPMRPPRRLQRRAAAARLLRGAEAGAALPLHGAAAGQRRRVAGADGGVQVRGLLGWWWEGELAAA
jgi:hypothetical protein